MKLLTRLLATAVGLLFGGMVFAQVPGILNPPANVDKGALITNTLQVAGTVNSAVQNNVNWQGVSCVLTVTVTSGSPSAVFSIQNYDAASATYYTVATSGTIPAAGPYLASLSVYPGAITGDAATGNTVKGVALTRAWRITETVAGTSNPAVTGKIGCNYLR